MNNLTSPDSRTRLERRAQRIADPVERLRFLRRETGTARSRGAMTLAWFVVPLIIGLLPLRVQPRTQPVPAPPELLPIGQTRLDADAQPPGVTPKVWRVESADAAELYSNGLRIDLTYVVANRPRPRFDIYSLASGGTMVGSGDQPVGIVYHTSESDLAPFEERANRRLKKLGQGLLELVRHERCYHYVVDRFGRVFRVVQEPDVAYHAGYSIWADTEGVYVNLNDSFIGISFEGQTGALEEVTPAQISSARALTEMLRSKYQIAAANCVTHAQVSVNPDNMRIGLHTDWAGHFPFAGLGLPDNYQATPASIFYFGFSCDPVFRRATGGAWKGLDRAEEQLRLRAEAEGNNPVRYRAALQQRYKKILASLKERMAATSASLSLKQGATP